MESKAVHAFCAGAGRPGPEHAGKRRLCSGQACACAMPETEQYAQGIVDGRWFRAARLVCADDRLAEGCCGVAAERTLLGSAGRTRLRPRQRLSREAGGAGPSFHPAHRGSIRLLQGSSESGLVGGTAVWLRFGPARICRALLGADQKNMTLPAQLCCRLSLQGDPLRELESDLEQAEAAMRLGRRECRLWVKSGLPQKSRPGTAPKSAGNCAVDRQKWAAEKPHCRRQDNSPSGMCLWCRNGTENTFLPWRDTA